jgi:DNA invertase Pin-like site-specific DNA recombinase
MEADCRRVAAEHGLNVVAVHLDDGISGAVRNRPAFLAWLADGREGRAGTLIAWHADRMTREGVNVAAMILDVVEGKDDTTGKVTRTPVRLLDTKGLDSWGDETAFRFRFVIAAEVARAERARMADRSKAAKRRGTAAGRWVGGHAPIGYRVIDNPNGAGRVLDIDPTEAAFVREAARRVLAGDTFTSVLRWANSAEGVPPRRAVAWGWKSLEQVLTGHPISGRVVRRVNGSRTEVVDVLGEDGKPVTIPAIVTPDESAALRSVLTPKADPRKRGGRKPSELLSGLMVCDSCGNRLTVARPTKDAPVYRCQIGKLAGCQRPTSVRCAIADAYVAERFLAAHGARPYLVRSITVAGAAEAEAAERDVAQAVAEVTKAATPEAVARLLDAQARRDAAAALPKTSEVLLLNTGRTVAEQWEACEDKADRRAMLTANIAEIHLKPNPGGKGGRGRAFYPERFVIVSTAPGVADVTPAESLRRGRVVVVAEHDPELDLVPDAEDASAA